MGKLIDGDIWGCFGALDILIAAKGSNGSEVNVAPDEAELVVGFD